MPSALAWLASTLRKWWWMGWDQRSSFVAIPTRLKAPRCKVSEWLSRYESYGVEGLLEGHRSCRPRNLTEQPRQQLPTSSTLGAGGLWIG